MPTRTYVYAGDHVLQEKDEAGVTQVTYTRTDSGELLSASDGTTTRYYEPDGLGSTDALSDDSQAVTDRWAYRAFGAAVHVTGSDPTPFTWVGRQGYFSDSQTGLYLLGSGTRYYDPQSAQFLSEDPIGLAGGDHNRLRYVWNQPTRATDASGLAGECLAFPNLLPQKIRCTKAFEADVANAFDIFKKCDEAKRLWVKCQWRNRSKIEVKCDDSIDNDAEWDSKRKLILINPNAIGYKDRSDQFMATMILIEMLNACANPRFYAAEQACKDGKLSVDQWVEKVERIEWENAIEHTRIAKACIKQNVWPAKNDVFAAYAGMSFADYLKIQVAGGHTDPIKAFWWKSCALAYFSRVIPKPQFLPAR